MDTMVECSKSKSARMRLPTFLRRGGGFWVGGVNCGVLRSIDIRPREGRRGAAIQADTLRRRSICLPRCLARRFSFAGAAGRMTAMAAPDGGLIPFQSAVRFASVVIARATRRRFFLCRVIAQLQRSLH